jgi:hypothetical protein
MSFLFKCDECKRPCGHEGEPGIHKAEDKWLCTKDYLVYLSTLKPSEEEEEDLYSF